MRSQLPDLLETSVPITIDCPGCGKRLKGPDTAAGKRAKCPECSKIVQFPAAQAPPLANVIDDVEDYDGDYEDDYDDFEAPAPRRRRAAPQGRASGGGQRKPCPMCGEMVASAARKCRFCGESFEEARGGRGGRRGSRRGRSDMNAVRTGVTIIYYGLLTALACAILLAVTVFALRNAGNAVQVVAVVFGIGFAGGVLAMLVGKFICLGVPKDVGTAWMIYTSCGIDVVSFLMQALKLTVGIPPTLALMVGVLSLAGMMIFLFFLKSLADYIRSDRCTRLARTVIIMNGVFIGIYMLIVLFTVLAVAGGGRPNVGLMAVVGISVLAVAVVGLVTLCLYGRLLTYLKEDL